MNQILIAGASGFIGKYLSKRFAEDGWKVMSIGRNEALNWDNKQGVIDALNQSKVLVNLSGKSVSCVHNEANKKEILESRVVTTQMLNEAILACSTPPQLWVNASGNAIYPRSVDKVYTEKDNVGDDTFMYEVCKAWETALYQNEMSHTRRIAFRTGVVLGKDGGILQQLSSLVKKGLGGASGSGKQMMSWIHIEDYYSILQFVINNKTIEGAVNLCAPNPENNKSFMKLLRKALKMPIGLPAPAFAVKIGAKLMGTEGSLALDSYNTVSSVLPEAGFRFQYPDLEQTFVNFYG